MSQEENESDFYCTCTEPPDLSASNSLILRKGCTVEHVVSYC